MENMTSIEIQFSCNKLFIWRAEGKFLYYRSPCCILIRLLLTDGVG